MAAVFYTKNEDGKLTRTNHPGHAEKVMLDIEEYNGLQNALRIVRDRSMQQIDKSQTDEHGYKLLRADIKKYNYRKDEKAWLITKSTPHSSNIPIREAMWLIKKDLEDYYNYKEFVRLDNENGTITKKLVSAEEFVTASEHQKKFPERDFLISNNVFGKALKQFMENYETVVFEISKVSVNYSSGVYEVSYWATDII